MDKVTVPHPYLDGLGIEITELETQGGKHKITYRFCRYVPGYEHPFSDMTEWQLEAMIEQWHAMKAERRRLQYNDFRNQPKSKSARTSLVPMRDIAESTIRNVSAARQSVSDVGNKYKKSQHTDSSVDVQDDDIPF